VAVPLEDRLIVAQGGGGWQMPGIAPALDTFLLDLARERSGRKRPRVCLVATATGDNPEAAAMFDAVYADRAEASHLELFGRTVDDIGAFLLAQDMVFVAGGNTANMLAIWRLHGVDKALVGAWEAGVLMSGMSAGGICWFEGSTTDSFGPTLKPLKDGLGILSGSFVPHYDGEAQRKPLFERCVADGTLPGGYAVDDGAALVFRGTTLFECISARPGVSAHRVERSGDRVTETQLVSRVIGQPEQAANR
jgi:peptidase E